jgi:hypothetical protein
MATQHVRTGALCGGRVEQIAVVVPCPPCLQRDPQRMAVRAMLEAR